MAKNGFRAFQRAKMSPQDTKLNTIICSILPKIKLKTVNPVLSGHSKEDQNLVFKTEYRLMQVKGIAEFSKGSILQYFRPSLSYHLSLRSDFCLSLSVRLRQFFL